MSDPSKKDLSGIIALLLIVVVALALTPTITGLVATAVAGGSGVDNLTGAAAAIVALVPLFWIIMIIAVALVGIKAWLQNG